MKDIVQDCSQKFKKVLCHPTLTEVITKLIIPVEKNLMNKRTIRIGFFF
jgi:hypothetical protein